MSQTQELELIQKKANAFKSFYEDMAKNEVVWTLKNTTYQCALPTCEADIPQAEKTLAQLKADHKAYIEEVKPFTSKLNTIVDRLNGYPKHFLEERKENGKSIRSGLIPAYESALLELKKPNTTA